MTRTYHKIIDCLFNGKTTIVIPENAPDQVRDKLRIYPESMPFFHAGWIPGSASGGPGMTVLRRFFNFEIGSG